MADTRERVLAVERILTKAPKTTKQIMKDLKYRYGIECERKAIYQDIAALIVFLDIQNDGKGYFIGG